MRGLRRCQQQLGSFVILGSGRGSIQQLRAFVILGSGRGSIQQLGALVIQRRFEQLGEVFFEREIEFFVGVEQLCKIELKRV